MEQVKSAASVIISRLIGFIIFVILLVIANVLVSYFNNSTFTGIVYFLNSNLLYIILITILLLLGELFGVLVFPFNLPSPLFNAVGAVFIVNFAFNLIKLVFQLINVNENLPFDMLNVILSTLVFLIIIIIGYVAILSSVGNHRLKKKHVKNR